VVKAGVINSLKFVLTGLQKLDFHCVSHHTRTTTATPKSLFLPHLHHPLSAGHTEHRQHGTEKHCQYELEQDPERPKE
jgi:hypothetical protein